MNIILSDASQKRRIFFATILTTLAAGCDPAPDVAAGKPGPSRLQTAIARRQAIMPAVARWKWDHNLPIEDRDRELKLIADFVHRAEARGLDAEVAKRLIEDQIEAAKEIQHNCFRRWNEHPPPRDSPVLDLATELRPRIDELTNELLNAAVAAPTEAAGPRPRGSSPR